MDKQQRGKLIMMVGIPGSGKSTYARQLAEECGGTIYSSDDLREKLFNNVNEQNRNQELFAYIHSHIKEDLKKGKTVIYDACNISQKVRRNLMNDIRNINCEKECVIVARTYESCIKANLERDRVVPIDVIKRMYKNWQTPQYFEGFNNINIIYPNQEQEKYGLPEQYVLDFNKYEQDNKHHNETLGSHLETTANKINELNKDNKDIPLYIAACIHDCGKPFCKSYKNTKGEPTDEAHYYQHGNVGAYNAMFFKTKVDKLYLGFIINNHDKPFQWEHNVKNPKIAAEKRISYEQSCNKFKRIWGEKLFNDVMKIYEADMYRPERTQNIKDDEICKNETMLNTDTIDIGK